MRGMWRWRYLNKEKIRDWLGHQKIGKDTYIIMILAGILLFIIALPIKDTPKVQKTTGDSKSSESLLPITGITDLDGKNTESIQEQNENLMSSTGDLDRYTQHLEEKLEKILSTVEGVGNVKVMITVNASGEQIIEKDLPNSKSITTEADADGGNRSINEYENKESTVYLTDSTGNQVPYVVKQLEPAIEGVMVVAQGGGNSIVNKNITEVIQALFGIEAHKIVVVKMKS